jgi:Galactose oxidase, central domain
MSKFLWTQKQDTGPRPRLAHGMAFDASHAQVILFGGDASGGQLFDDTWEWDGKHWTQVSDIGPSSRSGHAMAYDSVRKRVVLFGGLARENLRATWEWNGEDWTEMANDGPAARFAHAMAFDSARNRVVLFGGEGSGNKMLGDTWEWDGEVWTQVEDTGPGARKSCAAAYDTTRNRFVLFGGDSGKDGLGDTWEWNGTLWTAVADFGPEPRTAAAMAFKGDRVALFGGVGSTEPGAQPQVFGNTWEWDGTHWTQRQDIGPDARWGHAMAFDTIRDVVVIFGGAPVFPPGAPGTLFGDTWEHAEHAGGQPPPPPGGDLESFVIDPPSVVRGQRATGTVTLSDVRPIPASVLLTPDPNAQLLFDPPVEDRHPGFFLNIPPGTRSLQFRFRDQPGAPNPGNVPIPITAKFGNSTLTATITFT